MQEHRADHGIFFDPNRCIRLCSGAARMGAGCCRTRVPAVIKAMESTRGWGRDRNAMRAYEVRKQPSPLGYSSRSPAFDGNYRAERDLDRKSPSLTRQASFDASSGAPEFLSHADNKKRQRSWRDERKISRHRWLRLLACGLSLAISVFTTLLLTEPQPTTAAVVALMQAQISSTHSLLTAIKAAGLRGSPNVKGTIDAVKRLNDSQVAISGWAAEIGNSSAPLTVLAFVDGKVAFAMRTSGRHPDVVSVLGASDAPEAANVSFQGTAPCGHSQKLIVIAVTDGNSYGHFGARDCP